jgi:hypothetical protein
MIRKVILTVSCSILLLPTTGITSQFWSEHFHTESGGYKFGATETTLDVFGSMNVPDNRGFFDGRLGMGVGVNHFFTPWFGVGADTGIDKIDWPNHFNGSFVLRYPIEKWSLAPYFFTGFGRQFHDVSQWTYHFGGGVDYRLNQKTGLFVDLRETLPETSRDFMLWRFGVRLRF